MGRPSAAPPLGADLRGAARDQVIALIDLAVLLATSAKGVAPRVEQLNAIGADAPDRRLDPAAVVTDEIISRLGWAWEHGWQPLDLVHAARRQSSKQVVSWIALAVLAEADTSAAVRRAPQAWADQITALLDRHGRGVDLAVLLPTSGRASVEQWYAALAALRLLRILPASQLLLPPPSTWGRGSAPPVVRERPDEQRAKMLTKVRALLAKAESTDFAAEADALTAKAQDLMARHSIDEALLTAHDEQSFDVGGVRVLIEQPYALDKATLLHVVAEANRVRAIWNEFASCVTLIGTPTDVSQVDMLFTSTLVQATRAMTQADLSTAAFRRSFLHSFAVRIGERLTASAEEAVASYGHALVPVLERQGEAIDEEVERLFPHLTSRSRRRTFDARGWNAGRQAADAATLPAGEVGT